MARIKSKSSKLPKRRVSMKKRRSIIRKKGGGCGCGSGLGMSSRTPSASQPSPFLLGGNGPTPGLGELPGKYHYQLNDYNNDPAYSSIASRQIANILTKGGNSKGKGKTGRRSRKTGGANITGALINGLSMATNSTVVGSGSYSSGSNFFSAPYEKYTEANPPLA